MAITWNNVSGVSDRAGGQILNNSVATVNRGGQQIIDTLGKMEDTQNAEQSLAFKELLASARTPEQLEALRPQLDAMKESMTPGARMDLVGGANARLQTINANDLNTLNQNKLTRDFALQEQQALEAPALNKIYALQIKGKAEEADAALEIHKQNYPNSLEWRGLAENSRNIAIAGLAATRAAEKHTMEQEVKSGEVFSSKLGDIEKATESFNKAIKGNGIGTTEGGEILQKGLITAVPQEASRLDISTAIAAAAGKNDKINDLPPGMVLRVARAHADGKWEWDAGSDIAADLNALVADGVSGDEYRKNLNEQSVLQLSATDVLKRAKDRFAKTIFPKGTGAAEKQGEIIKAIDNDYKNKTMGQSNIVPPTNTEESSGTSPAVNNMSKIDNAAGGTELGDFRRTGTQLDNVKKAFVRDVTFPWTRRTIGNAFNTGNNAIMDAGEQLARQVFNAAPNSAKAKKNVLISLGAPKNIVPAKSPSEFREQLAQWENRKAIKPQRELKYGDEGFGLGNVRR